MPCYFPLTAYQQSCGTVVFREIGDIIRTLELPCGRCIGCRLERSRQWAVRCVHEAKLHDHSCFLTLTYSPDKLPPLGSLRYRDFQLFMKRLRRRFNQPIRFFMCGEYGESLDRPHYHALLFGLRFPDERPINRILGNSKLRRSRILDELWPHGFASIGDVNFDSAGYVARYALKKVTGQQAESHYAVFDPDTGEIIGHRQPEFCRMSLKPGIGAGWFDKYQRDVYPRGELVFNGNKCKPPRFYDKRFERADEDAYESMKFLREVDAKSGDQSDRTPERLAVRAAVAAALPKLKNRSI